MTREGLEYPHFQIVLHTESADQRAGEANDDFGVTRSGGLLADLLHAGQFRQLSPLVIGGNEPSRDLLEGWRSLVALPLYDHGAAAGMIILLGSSESECPMSELCGLAIMGALLQRAHRAYDLSKQFEDVCRALDAELAAAASVQRWLLPSPAPPVAGVEMASYYRPAHRAGGDY